MRNLLDRFTWHSLGSSTEVVLHWRGQQRWVPQHCKSANCVMRVWVWFLATWVPVVEEDSLSGHTLNALDCSCASGKFYHGAHAFPLWRYPYTKILSPTVYFLYCSTNTQSFMLSYQILVLLKRWSKKRDKRIRSSQSTSATWLEERKTLKPHLELKPSIFLLVFLNRVLLCSPVWPQTQFALSLLGARITSVQLYALFLLFCRRKYHGMWW